MLSERGYAPVSGSFGQPVIVQASAGFLPVATSADGGYTEQEIIIADLPLAGPKEEPTRMVPVVGRGAAAEWLCAPRRTGQPTVGQGRSVLARCLIAVGLSLRADWVGALDRCGSLVRLVLNHGQQHVEET